MLADSLALWKFLWKVRLRSFGAARVDSATLIAARKQAPVSYWHDYS
jgi:hypothetical protein